MGHFISGFINRLKWPVAFITILLLPKAAYLLLVVFQQMILDDFSIYLFSGMLAYLFCWIIFFRRYWTGHWFSVLEHELTHALFAFLTFQRVVGLLVLHRGGGLMRYQGVNNWLITVSPYFFPTFSLVVLFIMLLSKPSFYPAMSVLLGFSLLHWIYANVRQWSHDQPDLRYAGLLFTWMFLPAANIIVFLFIFAALPYDNVSVESVFSLLTSEFVNMILSIFKSFTALFH